jgi:aconitase A
MLTVNGIDYAYFDIQSAISNIEKLPYSLRILAEGILRHFEVYLMRLIKLYDYNSPMFINPASL